MPIEKWHPLAELEHMRKEMERIWGEFFPGEGMARFGVPIRRLSEAVRLPALDLIDKDNAIIVKMDVPGVTKEKIDIALHGDILTVKAESKEEKEEKEENYIRRERSYSSFERSVHIPVKVNPDKIKASMKDGILTVELPKEEEKKAKKIKIEEA
ncbi:MAG: Hsp20/alpha crystallin family protein [Deltaproteobacteria bacterium]|nr:Hsp20/alpha crystallin family protein [Deltaproteobacteria bacterium]